MKYLSHKTLFWSLVGLIVLPVLALSLGSVKYVKEQLTIHYADDVQNAISNKGMSLEVWINQRLGALAVMAKDPSVMNSLRLFNPTSTSPIDRSLYESMRENLNVLDVALVSSSGRMMMVAGFDQGISPDSEAQVLGASTVASASLNPTVSDLVISERVLILAAPVTHEQQRVGSLVFRVDATPLFDIINRNETRFEATYHADQASLDGRRLITIQRPTDHFDGPDGAAFHSQVYIPPLRLTLSASVAHTVIQQAINTTLSSLFGLAVIILAIAFGAAYLVTSVTTRANAPGRTENDQLSNQRPKPANEELRADLIENMHVGYLLTTDERIIIDANNYAAQLLGLRDANELIGRFTGDFYADVDDGFRGTVWNKAGPQFSSSLVEIRRTDEKKAWVEVSARALNQGDQRYIECLLHDVSEHIEKEDALQTARAEAGMALDARSRFIANLSHEMRTPMNAIIGLSHLAMRTDLNPQQYDYLKKIRDAGTGLLGIINEVLDMSKIEAGKIELEEEIVAPEDIVRRAGHLVSPAVLEKGLELAYRISPRVPNHIRTDQLRLGQVLLNLLSNAVKFTEQGEILVSLDAEILSATEVKLLFSVKDTGIGMNAEDVSGIFDQFSQADVTISKRFGGSGLGLTISKTIIELMGGEIDVSSTPGSGSEFRFSVQAKVPADVEERYLPAVLQNLRVLIIDDNRVSCAAIASTIERYVAVADTTWSGEDAIALLDDPNTCPYDLIFLDWMMPRCDGVETLARLKMRPGITLPPVIMMTAFDVSDLRLAAQEKGVEATTYVSKPLTPSDLMDVMLIALNQAQPELSMTRNDHVQPHPSLAGSRVLVVEDNPVNQQLTTELLSSAGIESDVADQGQHALEQLAQHTYDLILMDIQMPVMDGLTATRRIREMSQYDAIPILALTANAMPTDQQSYLAAGMQDCITKPINPDSFFDSLRKWLSKPATDSRFSSFDSKPAPPPPAALIPALPEVEGIDIENALRRVAGKKDLYIRLVESSITNHSNSARLIREQLANGHNDAAVREAHTVKGVAGNIGALALQEAAYALESALRAGHDHAELLTVYDKEIRHTRTLLNETLSLLRISDEASPAPTRNPDTQLANRDLVLRLQRLLDADDFEAVSMTRDQRTPLIDALGRTCFEQIERHLQSYDFEAARAALTKHV